MLRIELRTQRALAAWREQALGQHTHAARNHLRSAHSQLALTLLYNRLARAMELQIAKALWGWRENRAEAVWKRAFSLRQQQIFASTSREEARAEVKEAIMQRMASLGARVLGSFLVQTIQGVIHSRCTLTFFFNFIRLGNRRHGASCEDLV